tara:strand:- start:8830 stop:9570 length:741 start_codon:yes stop_codon:yes gene_type:complete
LIPKLTCRYKFFVINICEEYKRFGTFKIPRELIALCKKNKRVVFQFINDYGPICKYVGGFKFMQKKQITNDRLIIIDDDIFYHRDLFMELQENKTDNNITTGSGFNYDSNREYIVVEGKTETVEGYGGICFNSNQQNDFITWFVEFYKTIDCGTTGTVDKYLMACFLGDDFILSNIYPDKHAIKGGRKYIQPLDYGLEADALQNNTIFNGNMGSYLYLHKNITILETFKLKFELNKQIVSLQNKTL